MKIFVLPLLSLLLVALLVSWGIGTIFAWSFLLFALSLLLMLLFTVLAIRENKKDTNKNTLYGSYGDRLKYIGFLCKILLCIVIAITIFGCFEEYLNYILGITATKNPAITVTIITVIICSAFSYIKILRYIAITIIIFGCLFVYLEITATKYPEITATVICSALVAILLLNGCTNYYVNYIDKKILSLYNKPDGEYVIISNSAWLFWLPILWTEVAIIIGIGIKAKKDGDYIELNGISARYLPHPNYFSFGFCKNSYYYSSFHGFGKKEVAYNSKKERKEAERTYKGIYMVFTWDNGIWRFRIINRSLYNAEFDEFTYDEYNEYYWKRHSHDHLMGIYFSNVEHNYEEYNIIYRIITQTGENKIIKKEIDENDVIEYYHCDDLIPKQWFRTFGSISKITNTKEGYYYYWITARESFNIKEFMQLKGINLRSLFTYGNEDDGAIVYGLNGNYSKCSWRIRDIYYGCKKSTLIEPITQEEYLKILEYDNKYYREKESREERWRNIVHNIITQTNENEIIYKDGYEEYYYKEEHPVWSGMNTSIYKKGGWYYCIKGLECKNFIIKEFMKLNIIHFLDDVYGAYGDEDGGIIFWINGKLIGYICSRRENDTIINIYAEGDYDIAIADCESALRINPNHSNAQKTLENLKRMKQKQ